MINGNIITNDAGEKYIFALVPGTPEPLVAHESHPNFKAIVEQYLAGDEDGFAVLFDVPKAVSEKFSRLSERIACKNGTIYFDGDECHGTLVDTILAFMREGEEFGPLVKFFENIAQNASDHSREQLYDWLVAMAENDNIAIDSDGMLVGYKGVSKSADGSLVSGWSGKAIVNGVEVTGQIPNEVGSVVEMPRSEVTFDPGAACSRGLHVGTFGYASGYARGAILRVSVNPRDVVSVPTDAHGQKVRVCRYVIEEVIDAPVSGVLVPSAEALNDDEDLDLSVDFVSYVPESADEFEVGDRIADYDGDEAEVTEIVAEDSRIDIRYDNRNYGEDGYSSLYVDGSDSPVLLSRPHGSGGPTSQAAKGRGRNPAQDSAGRFSQGRPGSQRDSSTGRFV